MPPIVSICYCNSILKRYLRYGWLSHYISSQHHDVGVSKLPSIVLSTHHYFALFAVATFRFEIIYLSRVWLVKNPMKLLSFSTIILQVKITKNPVLIEVTKCSFLGFLSQKAQNTKHKVQFCVLSVTACSAGCHSHQTTTYSQFGPQVCKI